MTLDTTVALILLGILLYKSFELAVAWQKLRQSFIRVTRLLGVSDNESLRGLATSIGRLHQEFSVVVSGYLVVVGSFLGLFFLLVPNVVTTGGETFKASLAVSAVTIVSSVLITVLNFFIEKHRTGLEQAH